MRKDIKGLENIPARAPFIICSNHMHLLDPAAIAVCTKHKIVFMAKKDIFSSSFGKWFFKKLGAIPVSRDGNDSYSLKRALQTIKDGSVLGIFPEGTRVKNAARIEYKPGISMLAIKTNTPIVPVYLSGGYKIFGKINIRVGGPIDLSSYKDKKLTTEDYSYIANHIIAEEIFRLKEEI